MQSQTSTGNCSTGDYSTGDCSTGDCSTGYRSTGDCSTGCYSTGYRSTGDCSTGYRSTGDWSTGKRSTGDWSISKYSTGHFSTIDDSGFSAFDKPCTRDEWNTAEKPGFIYFNLTKWVSESDMTDKEKEDNPSYKTTKGYLKVYDYQEAWKIAYDEASKEDIELLKALPNFDAEVFEKISGIDVNDTKVEEMTMEEVCKALGKDIKIKK